MAKAPWYFAGLQELLSHFTPMVAGVLIPGAALLWLVALPYIDRGWPQHSLEMAARNGRPTIP